MAVAVAVSVRGVPAAAAEALTVEAAAVAVAVAAPILGPLLPLEPEPVPFNAACRNADGKCCCGCGWAWGCCDCWRCCRWRGAAAVAEAEAICCESHRLWQAPTEGPVRRSSRMFILAGLLACVLVGGPQW